MTTRISQEIAAALEAQIDRLDFNQTWAAKVIQRHQTYAGKRLKGKMPINLDELQLWCEALGLDMVLVVRQAIERAESSPDRDSAVTGRGKVNSPKRRRTSSTG